MLLAMMLPSLLAVVVFAFYFVAQPHWLADPDAQDYAQLGRQIAAGRGSTTRYMPWNGLDYLTRRDEGGAGLGAGSDGAPTWPNIVRFPLTPALMALTFAVFGPTDEAVHLPAGLAFVLAAGCVGLLGARAYNLWVGLTAGLTAAFLPLLVNYSLTGLTEPTLGMLILAVLACLAERRSDSRFPLRREVDQAASGPPLSIAMGRGVGGGAFRLVLGGVLFGLMILNRYDTALLVVPFLGLWLLRRSDWRAASARFIGPALIVVLPWAVHLTIVAGTPLFNLQPASIAAEASGRADGLGWYLPEYVSPAGVWLRDPSRAIRLAWEELAATPNHLRKLLGWPWLLAGAAACVVAIVRRRADLVVFLLVAVLLRALLASILGLNLQRHFVPLVPLLLVIVAGEADCLLRGLTDWLPRAVSLSRGLLVSGRAAVALALIVPGLWTIWPMLVPPSEPPGPPTRAGEVEARPESLARLAEIVGPGRLVASNVPWSVAWQADRHAVPLPPTVEETTALERRFGISVDAIYLAGQVAIADAPRSWRVWDDLRRRGTPPPGYVLAESFPNGGRLFVKQR
jgi:hypothetical protein